MQNAGLLLRLEKRKRKLGRERGKGAAGGRPRAKSAEDIFRMCDAACPLSLEKTVGDVNRTHPARGRLRGGLWGWGWVLAEEMRHTVRGGSDSYTLTRTCVTQGPIVSLDQVSTLWDLRQSACHRYYQMGVRAARGPSQENPAEKARVTDLSWKDGKNSQEETEGG